MEEKLRQVTDNIHGTIYLSDFESKMISTPFFYRLHDIYQSSTVYMTFPANRTKRYEHCLGTMHLAGEMFFSAMANTDRETKKAFIAALDDSFSIITKALKARRVIPFYMPALNTTALPDSHFKTPAITRDLIVKAMRQNVITDVALEHQRVCFFDLLDDGKTGANVDDVLVYAFLYQCAIEAIRIVGLFHDIGHPPFSHILEETLDKLYNQCKHPTGSASYVQSKADDLQEMLKPFVDTYTPPTLLIPSDGEIKKSALHEKIGLKMLQTAFRGGLAQLYQEVVARKESAENQTAHLLYYVTVIEFSFAILLEKTPVFVALHRMIDGPIDADRLDYIVRDSENAGINWGRIPYRRIVNSARLVLLQQGQVSLAFPEKMADDLDDILMTRYKVFSRINYHHRSTKTARLLQRAVFLLADDYLRTEEDCECISSDICDLWMSLGGALGATEEENKIAKWNDSWLISTLHNALIRLSDSGIREKLQNEVPDRDALLLCRLLEEILVNRKFYFSLLKRKKDAQELMDGILEQAGISNERLAKILAHEYGILFQATGENSMAAQESLYRIGVLTDRIKPEADFENLEIYFPFGSCARNIIDVLERAKTGGKIVDYIVSPNMVRSKVGITDQPEDRIFLYAPDGRPYPYDINATLLPLLLAQRATSLWLNVYIQPTDTKKSKDLLSDLNNEIKQTIGQALGEKFSELFPSRDKPDGGASAE